MTNAKSRGFTLIELMIVVAIVAILAAIAFPSYQQYVVNSWRAKAAGCLTELAQGMERRFTSNMSYAGAALPPNTCVAEIQAAGRYRFELTAGANTFLLEAIPEGVQETAETRCGTFSINQAGVKEHTGTAATAGECL